jgi:hypothetical protein
MRGKPDPQPIPLWITPKSEEQLVELVEQMGCPEAYHAMMFTWNYLVSLRRDKDEIQDDIPS